MTIVLTGGSGFIGTTLARHLLSAGHTVVVIDRAAPGFTHERLYFINCDLAASPLPYNILERTDAVINLVGAPIARKWTDAVKAEIRDSRVDSTRRIVEGIASAASRPPVFITASATGFYGDTGEHAADEQAPMGEGFLAEVVAEWEAAAREAAQYGVRVVLLRTAPVLGRGGMLRVMAKTAPLRFITRLTGRDFYFPWIHERDIVKAYMFALETSTLQGVVNACAPEAVTYQSFVRTLAQALRCRVIGTLPARISRIMFGEFAAEMTRSQHIVPQRLLDKGFVFDYPTADAALADIFHEKKR